MLTLDWPWLLLLLPAPLLALRLLPVAEQNQSALLVPFFASARDLSATATAPTASRQLPLLLLWLIWLLLVVAASRPEWVGDPLPLPASGRDLLVAVDISGSMETADMQWENQTIDRLTTVKLVVGDFVERRQSDRLGLVLFGTQAYLQAPLTFDRQTVKRLLSEAQLGFAGEKTAIGDAIGLAVKRLRDRPESSRVLILLTDGANTAGEIEPLQAADLAAQAHVKIYTIGIGADEMITPGVFGTSFGARRVNPSRDLDEPALRSIAEKTGGAYFRARNPADLIDVYQTLDQLEPVEQDAEMIRPTQSLFYWPLAMAVLLSLLYALVRLLPLPEFRRP